ncbi:hypothetical protein F5B18DRAFT_607858 [Nemania serpens]|nr:hypothetical protein F5B18DRAFT_607858 [Nemania serpens]
MPGSRDPDWLVKTTYTMNYSLPCSFLTWQFQWFSCKCEYAGETIPGYDVAEVVDVVSAVTGPSPGDLAILNQFGFGTCVPTPLCRLSACRKFSYLKDLAFDTHLCMSVNTTYFSIEEIRDARPGETIILNAGTSAASHYTTQFASRKGSSTILAIRDREVAETYTIKISLL